MSVTVVIQRVAPHETDILAEIAQLDVEAFADDCLAPLSIYLLARNGAVWAALVDGVTVASAVLLRNTVVPTQALLFGIAVCKAWQRRGIGVRLLTEILNAARCVGITEIELTVAPENTGAIRMYEKHFGFQYQESPKNDGCQVTRIVLRKFLR